MKSDVITDIKTVRISGYQELTNKGKALYRAKCQELINDGELRKSHLQSLILWADNYDRYWRFRKEVDIEGATFATRNRAGDLVMSANPKVKMMNDALKMANNILAEFGATLRQSRKLGKEQQVKSELDEWTD